MIQTAHLGNRTEAGHGCDRQERGEGAEYRFLVYVYPDGEPQISAERLSSPAAYFWYYSFELADFASHREQADTFLSELGRLLSSASRIVETQGWLFRSYECLLEQAGSWSRFGPHLALLAPRLRRRRRVFRSPPVAAP